MVGMSFWTGAEKPKDQTPMPAEPGYYKMFGCEDSQLYPNREGCAE